jgi:hypothetical protein
MKPGMLSRELKEALGMPDGAPPPWLINMQVLLFLKEHPKAAVHLVNCSFCHWPTVNSH